jgi:uncharacterized protein (TIGR00106 family)
MSVLVEFSMFPTSLTGSMSPYVSRVISLIRDSGFPYQLTGMGTLVETETLSEALDLMNRAYETLEPDCERVYVVAKMDIRKQGASDRLQSKVDSIESKIGSVRR